MLDARALQAQDLQGLSHDAAVQLATALLAQLAAKDDQLARREPPRESRRLVGVSQTIISDSAS